MQFKELLKMVESIPNIQYENLKINIPRTHKVRKISGVVVSQDDPAIRETEKDWFQKLDFGNMTHDNRIVVSFLLKFFKPSQAYQILNSSTTDIDRLAQSIESMKVVKRR